VGFLSGASLDVVVDRQRLVKVARGVSDLRHAGPAFWRADAPRFDERAQDCKRKIGMSRLDRSVEPVGQLALAL